MAAQHYLFIITLQSMLHITMVAEVRLGDKCKTKIWPKIADFALLL
jgi:hypothetical protein